MIVACALILPVPWCATLLTLFHIMKEVGTQLQAPTCRSVAEVSDYLRCLLFNGSVSSAERPREEDKAISDNSLHAHTGQNSRKV